MAGLNTDDLKIETPAAATSAPVSSDPFADDYITRRFARMQREPQAVHYEITRDAGYLHQYYRLREQMFITVWGLTGFSGSHDAYDDLSEIIVARIGNHVIGGSRMTFSLPDDHATLPMEKEDLNILTLLPELPIKDVTYMEVSRLAILPEFQNSFVLLELIREMIKRCVARKTRYAVTLAPLPLARNYRKATALVGLKWDIRTDIVIPDREEYEGIKMVLSVLDFSPLYRKKQQAPVSHEDKTVLLAVP